MSRGRGGCPTLILDLLLIPPTKQLLPNHRSSNDHQSLSSSQGRKYQEQDFSIISNAARCTDVTFSSSVHPCLKKIPTKILKDIFPIFWRSNLHFVEVKSIAILVKFCWLSRCPVATLVIFLSLLYCKAPTASQERRRQFKETAKVVTPPPL